MLHVLQVSSYVARMKLEAAGHAVVFASGPQSRTCGLFFASCMRHAHAIHTHMHTLALVQSCLGAVFLRMLTLLSVKLA